MGERPAILSRGYGRTRPADGVVVVRDPDGIRADLARSGDEPLMLARQLPGVSVLASPDRYLAGVWPSITSAPPSTCWTTASSTCSSIATWTSSSSARRRRRAAGDAAGRPAARAARYARRRRRHRGRGRRRRDRREYGADVTVFRARRRALGRPEGVNAGARSLRSPASRFPQRFFDDLHAAGCTVAGTLRVRDHHPLLAPRRAADRRDGTRRGREAGRDHGEGLRAAAAAPPFPCPPGGCRLQWSPSRCRVPALARRVGLGGSRHDRWRTASCQQPGGASACRGVLRHRLEYLAVVASSRCVRAAADARRAGRRHAARARVLRLRSRATGGWRSANLQAAFPAAFGAECRAIAREMFSHFGRLLMVLLKFSTHAAGGRCSRASSSRARSASSHAHAQGGACCSSPGTSGSGRSTRSCTR